MGFVLHAWILVLNKAGLTPINPWHQLAAHLLGSVLATPNYCEQAVSLHTP